MSDQTYTFDTFDAAAWTERLIRTIPDLQPDARDEFLAMSLEDRMSGLYTIAALVGDKSIRDQAARWLQENAHRNGRVKLIGGAHVADGGRYAP